MILHKGNKSSTFITAGFAKSRIFYVRSTSATITVLLPGQYVSDKDKSN